MNPSSSYTVPDYPQLKPQTRNLNKENNAKNVLYFSTFCENCNKLLDFMQKENLINEVDLVCIDNRFVKDNITYINVNGTHSFPLPPMINCVPTLCLMPNHEVLSGAKIVNYFKPMCKNIQEERDQINMEPNPYCIEKETNGMFGVCSDSFSFYDTNSEDLTASGEGGTRQLYSYATIGGVGGKMNDTTIHTPQDEGREKKINMSLEEYQNMRNNEL